MNLPGLEMMFADDKKNAGDKLKKYILYSTLRS